MRTLTVKEIARAIPLFFLGIGLVLAAFAMQLPEASKAELEDVLGSRVSFLFFLVAPRDLLCNGLSA